MTSKLGHKTLFLVKIGKKRKKQQVEIYNNQKATNLYKFPFISATPQQIAKELKAEFGKQFT